MIEYVLIVILALEVYFYIKKNEARVDDMECDLRILMGNYKKAKKLWKR
jgi:hypothetical protein